MARWFNGTRALALSVRHDPGARMNAIGLSVNVVLAGTKLVVGTLAGSVALVADGLNSVGDIAATAIGWAGYRLARTPPDENHPFGHGKIESLAGLVIGGILLSTGVFIFVDGVRALAAGGGSAPGVSALWVALATALIKEALYRATYRVGTELRAPSLLASARDHRADVWAAGTVCAGVLGARAGVWWIDPMAALCIGLYIAWMAWEPIRANLGVLTDEADPKRAATIRTVILEDDAVLAVPSIRVHPFGAYDRVEVEITVDGRSSLQSAHQVAHRAEDRVIERVAHVRAVHVHVNPQDEI